MVSGESIWWAAAGFPLEAGFPRVFVFTGKSVELISGVKNLLIFTIANYNVYWHMFHFIIGYMRHIIIGEKKYTCQPV